MNNWKQSDIDKITLRNLLIVGDIKKKKKKKVSTVNKTEPIGLTSIKHILTSLSIDFVEEYRFIKGRRFRFDVAILDKNIAIEYEGIFSKKSRHTSIKGYSRDTEKYNIAASEGWTVLRYTAISYQNFENDIKKILNI